MLHGSVSVGCKANTLNVAFFPEMTQGLVCFAFLFHLYFWNTFDLNTMLSVSILHDISKKIERKTQIREDLSKWKERVVAHTRPRAVCACKYSKFESKFETLFKL